MQTPVFSLIVGLAFAACNGLTRSFQSDIDDSALPSELRAAYRDDAARLALRDIFAGGGTNEIVIPEDRVRPYYDALVLVYNATGLPARDTVVDVYRIHTWPSPVTRSLMLLLDPGQEWVQRLARREIPTGEPAVDDLLQRYSLSVGSMHTMSQGDILLTLGPAQPLNIAALAPLFSAITGVRSSSPNGAVGDGNDIRGSRAESDIRLDYSVGSGDCPSGCISRRSYRFAVDSTGKVEYLGSSGDPPLAPAP